MFNINISRNLFFSLLSYGLKIFNNLILFALLARIVPIDVFGIITFFVVLIKITDKIVESGHKLIIVKEISADNSLLTQSYIGEKITYKCVMFTIVLISFIGYGMINDFWGYHPLVILSIAAAGFFSALSNINIALYHVFSKFYLETISLAILSVVLLAFLVLTWVSNDEQLFIMGYFVGSVIMYLLSSFLLKRDIMTFSFKQFLYNFNISSFSKVFKYTLPFAMIIVLEVLFGNFDIFFIEHLYTNAELGAYSGLKKILAGLSLFMLICSDYLMPRISKSVSYTTNVARRNIIRYFGVVSMLGVSIFLLYWALDFLIIKILLGDDFAIIQTWNFNIGVIVVAMYLRIIPVLYFISFGYEKLILKFYAIFLILGSLYFYFNLNVEDITVAVNAFTYIQVFLTFSYIGFFFWYLSRENLVNISSQKAINSQ